jgi:uncharacterized membrane protein
MIYMLYSLISSCQYFSFHYMSLMSFPFLIPKISPCVYMSFILV